MPEKKSTSKPAKSASHKHDDLEERVAALELFRKAFDGWTAAAGAHPISIFEDAIRNEEASA